MTHHSPTQEINAQATADYIASLSKELADLARGQRLDFLAYLLDMATTEARDRSQNPHVKRETLNQEQF